MTDESTTPKSYLLRLWPVQIEGQLVWRAYLKTIPGGQELGFADLNLLFEHLKAQTCDRSSDLGRERTSP